LINQSLHVFIIFYSITNRQQKPPLFQETADAINTFVKNIFTHETFIPFFHTIKSFKAVQEDNLPAIIANLFPNLYDRPLVT